MSTGDWIATGDIECDLCGVAYRYHDAIDGHKFLWPVDRSDEPLPRIERVDLCQCSEPIIPIGTDICAVCKKPGADPVFVTPGAECPYRGGG